MADVDVRLWWATLSVRDRASLRVPRAPAMARYVESDADDDGADLYEWVVGHELAFFAPRVFHICTAHPEARGVLARGLLPRDFACPLGRADCPMRGLVVASGGRDVRLREAR